MEALNLTLFDLINATPSSPAASMLLAHLLAVYAIYLVPALLVVGWLRRDQRQHQLMLCALLACGVALSINFVIGSLWHHPRPFVMPVGHTFLQHAPDASFPSDHMTIIMTVAFSLLLRREVRLLGLAFAILGLGIAWSRIYLGVHFPLDMLGGTAVALASACLARVTSPIYMPTLYRVARGIHRRLFATLIERGWVSR